MEFVTSVTLSKSDRDCKCIKKRVKTWEGKGSLEFQRPRSDIPQTIEFRFLTLSAYLEGNTLAWLKWVIQEAGLDLAPT